MECPECGDPNARATPLLISMSYVCSNQTCGFFDYHYTLEQCAGAFGEETWISDAWSEELDSPYLSLDDDPNDDPNDGLDDGAP